MLSHCPARDAELKKTGKLVVSASLDGPQAAFALRPRSGKTQVIDGPYADAKEMVEGLFAIEAADKGGAGALGKSRPTGVKA